MPFDKLSLKELKELAKQHKDVIKGYTKMGKEDLVKLMKKQLKMDRKGEVTKKVSGGKLKTMKEVKHEFEHPKEFVGEGVSEKPSLEELKKKLLSKVDKLSGGQLPSSVTDKLEDLEIKGTGHRLFKGKAGKTIHRIGGIMTGSKSTGSTTGDIGVAATTALAGDHGGDTAAQSKDLAQTYTCNTSSNPDVQRACNKKAAKAAMGMGIGDDKTDWEDMKWGSFTEQLQQFNRTHKKQMKDLKGLAEHVRANPSKFQPKTKKRADFYINVILKKKSK